jgi:hypothetical protein
MVVLTVAVAPAGVHAATYEVSPHGNDADPGTADKPFQTIARAAALLQPGDTCRIRAGTYRESIVLNTAGSREQPIRIIGETRPDGSPAVVLDGTDPLEGKWTPVKVNGVQALAIPCAEPVTQLFFRGRMMTEARWPDQRFDQVWDRSTWARSEKGSKKDLMICSALAETGVDWTGAMATLNVGHQFKTWSRTITRHRKGEASFTYALEERMNTDVNEGPSWWDDRFYLTGRIEALTSPEEWFYDPTGNRLYFIPPSGKHPRPGEVTVKTRDFGLSARNLQHVRMAGINFFGCTFNFQHSDHLLIENCRVLYPNYAGILTDTLPKGKRAEMPHTLITGNHNTLRKISVACGNTSGIKLTGSSNRLENSIVHDVCWAGNLGHPGILIHALGKNTCSSTVSGCTVYNTGNVGIRFQGPDNLIEFNHVYNTGLACKDIAAIHTGSPQTAGSIARRNWVHGSRGKGMRGDDQTRHLTFHHNVIWDCDEGMIVKGDFNACYNNTIIGADGHGCLIIPTRPEPRKWWSRTEFLDRQNANSMFCSNLVETIVYRHEPLPETSVFTNNVELAGNGAFEQHLAAPAQRNFRPGTGSPLIARGTGAYESSGEYWTPGADWKDPSIGIELAINAEVARSWQIAGRPPSVRLPKRILESSLSPLSKSKLQSLFDTCWTPEEINNRKKLIERRRNHPEESEQLQKEIVELHRQANERLKERAGDVLSGSELTLFLHAM